MTKQKYQFGVALGGGGVRAITELGVLEVIEEAGIKIDCISGASMGSIIAAIMAMGIPRKDRLEILKSVSRFKFNGLSNFNLFRQSLLKNTKVKNFLDHLFGTNTFENCRIPLRVVAVDIETGKSVIFKEGPLKEALLASSATPFIFPPVFSQGRVLVDGSLVDDVPFDFLKKEFKPGVTLTVEPRCFVARRKLSSAIFENFYAPQFKDALKPRRMFQRFRENVHLCADIFLRTMEIAIDAHNDQRTKDLKPDIAIMPETDIGFLEFERAEEAYELGKKLMKAQLPKLKKLLGMRK